MLVRGKDHGLRHRDARGLGEGEATVLTVDLTPGYIDENMRTS